MQDLPSPVLPESFATPPPTPHGTSFANDVPTPIPHPAQKGHKRALLIGGAVIVGVGTLSGLGYAAWSGYNPLVKRPTPEQFFAAIQSITSAETTFDVHFAIEPREGDVEPIDFSLFQEKDDTSKNSPEFALSSLTSMLPSDLEFNLFITSSFTKNDKGGDEESHFTGTYTANNVSANLDITTRTVNGMSFVKPDAIPLPIPFFDMGALEGKWINLEKEAKDMEVFEYTNTRKDKDESDDKKITNPQAEFFALLQQAVTDGAIIPSVPKRITSNNERAWFAEVMIDGEKLRETAIRMGENRETLFPEVTEYSLFTDNFLEVSNKERAKDVYREIFKRMKFSITLDDNALPLALTLSTRLAPKLEDDLLKDRQITFETEVLFKNINAPLEITVPEETISTTEALGLMMGKNPEQNLVDNQRRNITDLQKALDLYKEENGTYPNTLQELMGTEDKYKTVTHIPTDLFTEESYTYELTQSGYTLQYTMPEAPNDESSLYALTVGGINTATELFFSEEGAKLTDKDEDGLSAYEEISVYGTSDELKDTDSDGFDDKTEIDAGYDPNTKKPKSDPMPRRLL